MNNYPKNTYPLDDLSGYKKQVANWFEELRNKICAEFEVIELEYANAQNQPIPLEVPVKEVKFKRKIWQRDGGGSGQMSVMKGNVFEKVGVNFSSVFGDFADNFRGQIPGTEKSAEFWASGISLVAHMRSPLVPAVHMNTRFIATSQAWFGGGADLNPIYEKAADTKDFHLAFHKACDAFNPNYYPDFKKYCDEYFFIKHRNEARGVGGIFYDYLNTGDFEKDFAFTKQVGLAFLDIFPKIVRRNMFLEWSDEEREYQFHKRGRYAEFNLIYDRGTKFGLMTNGNAEAILMSLPPIAKWD